MIRRLARIDAPVPAVRDVFLDTDAWPRWMPSVESTRTLVHDEDRRLVEVGLLVFGRRLLQKLDCREQGGRLIHRQVEGRFRKWEAVWDFRPPPEGDGTTASLTLDFDLGLVGRLLPGRLVGSWVSGLIDRTLEQGGRRARELARSRRQPTQAVELGQPLLEVFETVDGLEVRFAGRTFHLEAYEASAERREEHQR